MPIIPHENLQDLQSIHVPVGVPDAMKTLIILNGLAIVPERDRTRQSGSYRFLVGPPMPSGQFNRAIVSASPSSFGQVVGEDSEGLSVKVVSLDAHLDDESGMTEVRIETEIGRGNYIEAFSFSVAILAY